MLGEHGIVVLILEHHQSIEVLQLHQCVHAFWTKIDAAFHDISPIWEGGYNYSLYSSQAPSQYGD